MNTCRVQTGTALRCVARAVPCALLTALAGAFGCAGAQMDEGQEGEAGVTPPVAKALAIIEPRSGSSTNGMASFTSDGKTVTLQLEVANAPPGEHAVHIHEKPDCSAPDAQSAGPHWNPTGAAHGKWGEKHFHLGDIGNLEIDDKGRGSLTLSTELWTIGTGLSNDVVDHAIVVHIHKDDFATQPDGAGGTRIGCGVIKRD
jgi:Cu-Zn family superoxide dismutase